MLDLCVKKIRGEDVILWFSFWEFVMRLCLISEGGGNVMSFYKVVDSPGGRPDCGSMVPGYMTSVPDLIHGYLSAFISGSDGPGGGGVDVPVWIVRADVDVDELYEIEGLVFGYNQDKSILPGYYGDELSPDDGIKSPLDVIVLNEPVDCEVVGGYVPSLNYDFDSGKMNAYIMSGNAWKFGESDLGNFDDLG